MPRKIYDPMTPQQFAEELATLNEMELASTAQGLATEYNNAKSAREDLIRQFPTLMAEIDRRAHSKLYADAGVAEKYKLASTQYHAARMNEVTKTAPPMMRMSYINNTDTDALRNMYIGSQSLPETLRQDSYINVQRGVAQDLSMLSEEHGSSIFSQAQALIALKEQGIRAVDNDSATPSLFGQDDLMFTKGFKNRAMIYELGVQDGSLKDVSKTLLPGLLTTVTGPDGTLLRKTRPATVRDVMTQLRTGKIDDELYNSFAKLYHETVAKGDTVEAERIRNMPITRKIIAAAVRKNPNVADFTAQNEPTGLDVEGNPTFGGNMPREFLGIPLAKFLPGGDVAGAKALYDESPLLKYIGGRSGLATDQYGGESGFIGAKLGKLFGTETYKKAVKDDLNYWTTRAKTLREEAIKASDDPDLFAQYSQLSVIAQKMIQRRLDDMKVSPQARAAQIAKTGVPGDPGSMPRSAAVAAELANNEAGIAKPNTGL